MHKNIKNKIRQSNTRYLRYSHWKQKKILLREIRPK